MALDRVRHPWSSNWFGSRATDKTMNSVQTSWCQVLFFLIPLGLGWYLLPSSGLAQEDDQLPSGSLEAQQLPPPLLCEEAEGRRDEEACGALRLSG